MNKNDLRIAESLCIYNKKPELNNNDVAVPLNMIP